MADLDALSGFLNAHKRVLDALPRIQDEAIESGDYTKVDNAHEALDRLEKIGGKIIDDHGIDTPDTDAPGLLGPIGQEGQEGPAEPPPVPAGVINPMGLPQAGPKLLQAPQLPTQSPAPVVVNVQAPGAQAPNLLSKTPQEQNVDQYKSIQDKIEAARNAVRGYIKGHADAAIRNASQAAAAGGFAPPFNPSQKLDDQLQSYIDAPSPNMVKAASDIRAMHGNGDKNATAILDILEKGAQAQRDLEAMRQPGQPLGLTREEVMPRQPKLLAERQKVAQSLKEAGELEAPQLLRKQNELDAQLKNIQDFDKANPMASTQETPVGLTQGEPGEAEARAGGPSYAPPQVVPEEPAFSAHGETLIPGVSPKPSADPGDLELNREYKGEVSEPVVTAGEGKQPVRSAPSSNPVADSAAELRRRIDQELGGHPGAPKKKTFLDYLALILTGGKVAAIWNQQRSDYEHAKEKIGSEVYNTAKAKLIADEQYKRLTAQIEAANTRQDKQLAYRSAADKALNDIRNSQMQQQWNIANLRLIPQQKHEQAKALQTKINTLNKEYDDISRQLQSFAITPDQWNTMTKPNREEVYKVQGQYDDLVATQPTEVQLPTVKEAPPQPQK